MVARVFPHGVVEIFYKDGDGMFKVNGQRLKPYHDGFSNEVIEQMALEDPRDR